MLAILRQSFLRLMIVHGIFFAGSAVAEENVWTPVKSSSGMQLYTRPVGKLIEVKGYTKVGSSIGSVLATLDPDTTKQSNQVVVRRESPTEAVLHQIEKFPAGFEDRYFVFRTSLKINPDHRQVVIKFSSTDSVVASAKKAVLGTVKGSWDVRDIDGKSTQVEFRFLADFGGSMHSWPLKSSVDKKIIDTVATRLHEMKKQAVSLRTNAEEQVAKKLPGEYRTLLAHVEERKNAQFAVAKGL